MSDNPVREHVTLSVDPHSDPGRLGEAAHRPFQVLVLGDFSARDAGTREPREDAGARVPIAVDSVDDALARLRPAVDLVVAGNPVRVEFRELDDFHPDRLVERITRLRDLVESIGLAESDGPERPEEAPPTGGPEQAPGMRGPEEATATGGPRNAGRQRDDREGHGVEPPATPAAGLLEDIVASAPDRTPERSSGPGSLPDLQPWLREVVAPYLEEAAAGPDGELVRSREAEASAAVRDVLHHPAVRELERSWRSLLLLSRAVAPVAEARLHVLDLSRRELAQVLGGEPGSSPLSRIVSDALPGAGGATQAALLVGTYAFGPEAQDLLLLNRLAILSHLAGVPFLAEASSRLLGLDSFADWPEPGQRPEPAPGWAAFRETGAAASVALLAPRVLLRTPYGPSADPCEAFPFDELSESAAATHLWGSPAFLVASAAVEAFHTEGWGLDLAAARDLDGLPIHVAPSGAVEAHVVESVWPRDVVEHVMEMGVNPVIGFKNATRARLPGVYGASSARAPVVSWWSR